MTCLIDRWGQGNLGDRHRRLRSPRRGRQHHHAAGPGCSGGRSRHRVVVLISKPPIRRSPNGSSPPAEAASKPIVVNFLGAGQAVRRPRRSTRCAPSRTRRASRWLCPAVPGPRLRKRWPRRTRGGGRRDRGSGAGAEIRPRALQQRHLLLRGAAPLERSPRAGPLQHTLEPGSKLADKWQSQAHTAIYDLNDDVFTRGRPHPMIDQTLRCGACAGGGRPGGRGDPVRCRARLWRAPGSGGRAGGRDRGNAAGGGKAGGDHVRRLGLRHRRGPASSAARRRRCVRRA